MSHPTYDPFDTTPHPDMQVTDGPSAGAEKRCRLVDLRILYMYFLTHIGSIPVTDKRESYEVGACITAKHVCYLLGLKHDAVNAAGSARWSTECLQYARGLLEDLPRCTAMTYRNTDGPARIELVFL